VTPISRRGTYCFPLYPEDSTLRSFSCSQEQRFTLVVCMLHVAPCFHHHNCSQCRIGQRIMNLKIMPLSPSTLTSSLTDSNIIFRNCFQTSSVYAGFEVITAVVMNISIFSDVTPCSPSKLNYHFVRICRLHLQGRRISQERDRHEAGSK
jgi:hypothetical protein